MGSDNGDVQQAGTVDMRRWVKGQQIVGADRQALAKDLTDRYSQGTSIRALAARIGRSYGFVHRVLTEAGVCMRQQGGSRRPRSGIEQGNEDAYDGADAE